MNRHIYHYCASNGSNQLAGIAQLTFRIMTQKDIHRFMGELEKIGFKAEAITSLSYLGEDGECAGQADYKVVVQGLLEERSKIGMDIDAAIRDGVVPDDHPLRSRLEMLANHRHCEQGLAAQLKEATRQCGVMADSLRYLREFVTTNVWDDEERSLLLESIDAATASAKTD